ncbi:MAG: hypothetical protein ACJ77K_10550 [Bacteroidia bacterium]
MNRNYSRTCLSFLFGILCLGIHAQNPDTIRIGNKQSILNDRAFFDFPVYAKNIKRGVDIMSADPNENEETRIVLDLGEMRLVFYAQELFSLGDNKMLDRVKEQNEKINFRTKVLCEKDSLFSILSSPLSFDSTQNAILVNSLLVKTQDNTLFKISAYINPAAYEQREHFQKLTETVFSTLSKGARANTRTARKETHALYGSKKNFIFDLPADYFITTDQQYDFQVFKLHKYQLMSDTSWVKMIIYLGNHPSPLYKSYGLTEKDAKTVKGSFLEKKADWLSFDIKSQNIIEREQLFDNGQVEQGLIVHVVMISDQNSALDDLTKIAESIRLK